MGISFEVAGIATTFKQSIEVTKGLSTMVILSVFARPIEWNPIQLTNIKVNIVSFAYTPTSFQQTVDLMGTDQLKPQPVITDHIQLDNIVEKNLKL